MEKPEYIEPGDGRLPPALVVGLDEKTQHALNHPVRRELLRCLNKERVPRTVGQLALDFPPATLSRLSYHLKVLARYGAARVVGAGAPSYMSALGEEPSVLAVLQVTEEWDRAQRQAVAKGASGLDKGGPVE